MLKNTFAPLTKNNILYYILLSQGVTGLLLYNLYIKFTNMFSRKILFLAAWYVAGNVVSSVYSGSQKKWRSTTSKLDPQSLAQKFFNTQKNMISDVEKKYLSKEQQKKVSHLKKDITKSAKKYVVEWKKILGDISQNETFKNTQDTAKKHISKIKKSGKEGIKKVRNTVSSNKK